MVVTRQDMYHNRVHVHQHQFRPHNSHERVSGVELASL